jgi:hypothetical protein
VLERAILAEYEDELERSKSPDYRPQTFPDLDYDEPAADVAQS